MIRVLRIDMEKTFGSYRFYVAVIGIAAGSWLHALENMTYGGGRSGAENLFLGVRGAGMSLLGFMLCVMGGAFTYCEEQRRGNCRMVILRTGLPKYVAAKVIGAMISGFLVMVLGKLLALAGMMVMVQVGFHGSIPVLAGGRELEETLFYIAGNGLLGALLSVVGLAVTTIQPNFFVGLAAPILFYYLWLSLDAWIGFPEYLSMDCYFQFIPEVWRTWQWQFFYALVFTCVLSGGLGEVCRKMINRRL